MDLWPDLVNVYITIENHPAMKMVKLWKTHKNFDWAMASWCYFDITFQRGTSPRFPPSWSRLASLCSHHPEIRPREPPKKWKIVASDSGCYSLLLKMKKFVVDLPIETGGSFHSHVKQNLDACPLHDLSNYFWRHTVFCIPPLSGTPTFPYLVGGIPTPLKNISQLGWWHSKYMEK